MTVYATIDHFEERQCGKVAVFEVETEMFSKASDTPYGERETYMKDICVSTIENQGFEAELGKVYMVEIPKSNEWFRIICVSEHETQKRQEYVKKIQEKLSEKVE